MEVRGQEDVRIVGGSAYHHRTSAVAEQHGHVAAARAEVESRRMHLAADDEDVLVLREKMEQYAARARSNATWLAMSKLVSS